MAGSRQGNGMSSLHEVFQNADPAADQPVTPPTPGQVRQALAQVKRADAVTPPVPRRPAFRALPALAVAASLAVVVALAVLAPQLWPLGDAQVESASSGDVAVAAKGTDEAVNGDKKAGSKNSAGEQAETQSKTEAAEPARPAGPVERDSLHKSVNGLAHDGPLAGWLEILNYQRNGVTIKPPVPLAGRTKIKSASVFTVTLFDGCNNIAATFTKVTGRSYRSALRPTAQVDCGAERDQFAASVKSGFNNTLWRMSHSGSTVLLEHDSVTGSAEWQFHRLLDGRSKVVPGNLEGTWQLVAATAPGAKTKYLDSTLTFEKERLGPPLVTGRSGCISFTGVHLVSEDLRTSIGDLTTNIDPACSTAAGEAGVNLPKHLTRKKFSIQHGLRVMVWRSGATELVFAR